MIRTNPPSYRTLMTSLFVFLAGCVVWYVYPSLALYAFIAMFIGYAILFGGSVLKGV